MKSRTGLSRILATLTISLLMGGSALAESNEIVRPGIHAGESFSWDYRRKTETQYQNTAKKTVGSVTAVTAKVIEASSSGYILEWTYGDTHMLDAPGPEAAAAQWVSDVAKELRFELQLDPEGQFVRLRNYEQLRSKIDQVIEQVMAAIAKERKATPAEMTYVGKMLKEMFGSQDRVETLMLKDVRLLLFPFGMPLDSKAPITYQTQLPNPFGEDSLQADGTLVLTSLDTKQGVATISLDQKLSADSVPKMLAAMIQRMGENRPPSTALSKLRADINDHSTYTVDLKSGLAREVEFTRTVTMPGGSRIDRVSFIGGH